MCCKYDIINVWNGNLGFNLRPRMFIKKIVQTYNFKNDFKACNKKSICAECHLHGFASGIPAHEHNGNFVPLLTKGRNQMIFLGKTNPIAVDNIT